MLEVGDLLCYGEVDELVQRDTFLHWIMIWQATPLYSNQICQRPSGDVGSQLSDDVEICKLEVLWLLLYFQSARFLLTGLVGLRFRLRWLSLPRLRSCGLRV